MPEPTEPVEPTRPLPATTPPPQGPAPQGPNPTPPGPPPAAAAPGPAPAPATAVPPQPAPAVPLAPAVGSPAPGPAAGPEPKRPGLWRQATSTTGGTIAVIVAASLVALLVMGLLGVGFVATARVLSGHRGAASIGELREGAGSMPPGLRKKLGQAPVKPGAPGAGPKDGLGNGIPPLLRGALGVGKVQHGEFTLQGSDGKATTMTVQRGTVSAASATSITVKSADGFTATYAVDASTQGNPAGAKAGSSVLVVAQKDGAKALLVRVEKG